jgi:hypothetical protein
MKTTTQENLVADSKLARRSFLKYAGASAMAAGVLATAASCQKHGGVVGDPDKIDLGVGDIAVLNYAYALEQLEAAFYSRVMQSPYTGMNADERALLTDVRDHEIGHREFFKKALGANAIIDLTPNFGTIDFGNRASVLGAAKTFEDLGVAAYNGAGAYIQTPEYLVLAGKIVSVEARHAVYIRTLLNQPIVDNTIVDLTTGLERSQTPARVLAQANTFISGKPLASPALDAA